MAGAGKPGPAKGDRRAIEAGRKGGSAVMARRGREFFQTIGQKGGQATKEKYGPEFFSQIGTKGGASCLDQHGKEHFAKAGQAGGRGRAKSRVTTDTP